MSSLKAEIKMGVASELGLRLDDMLEAANKEVASYEGGKQALGLAYSKLNEHLKFIDKDVEEGRLTIEQATLVKKYFLHGMGIIQNLATSADVQRFQAIGKVLAYESSVKAVKSMFDAEKAKVAALEAADAAVAAGTTTSPIQRSEGTHPGNPLADRRSEVGQPEAAISAPEVPSTVEPTPTTAPMVEEEEYEVTEAQQLPDGSILPPQKRKYTKRK